MAWLESAVVVYLRTLVDRLEPHQPNPLPDFGHLASTEKIREAATLVMLIAVGCLAGWNARARFAYVMVAFGVWDIFYYVFLRVICGWPKSLLDWDVLFLLPLPWWGPVLSPMLIAALMIVFGTIATQTRGNSVPWPSRKAVFLNGTGDVLALYVFMSDAIRAIRNHTPVENALPARFDWPLFLIALALMAAPVVDILLPSRRVMPAASDGSTSRPQNSLSRRDP